jgi:flagellar protein FlaG
MFFYILPIKYIRRKYGGGRMEIRQSLISNAGLSKQPTVNQPITKQPVTKQAITHGVNPLVAQNRVISHLGLEKDSKKGFEKEKPTLHEITEVVDSANHFFQAIQKNLRFQMHEDSSRLYVEVVNAETNDIIKEIPSKEFLDVVARIKEAVGILVDEKI